jgi:hypothetical protein
MARTPKKTLLIQNYIDNNIGKRITVQELADIAECTIQNVYVFIRSNSDRFHAEGKGLYVITPKDTTYITNSINLESNDGTI